VTINRRLRTGGNVDAYCTRCKSDFAHTILAMADEETPERVRCNTCGSEHRFIHERSVPRIARPSAESGARAPIGGEPRERKVEEMDADELVAALRELLESTGATAPIEIGRKWEGGTLLLRPGKPGLQEKEIPIETFFRKIVMVRERLRVLEQQINASSALSDAEKLGLQQYITRCYGSLTTFNALFESRDDWFVGEKKSDA
jgi:hypothetical protein